nr:undecaprenyl-phosphate glucose phosphotransferase [uncultured Cohaesibacter sp.]
MADLSKTYLQSGGDKPRDDGNLSGETANYRKFLFPKSPLLPSQFYINLLLRILDFALVWALGYLIFVIYVDDPSPSQEISFRMACSMTASVSALMFHFYRLYPEDRVPTRYIDFRNVVLAWTVTIIMLLVIIFFSKTGEEFSRVWLLTWYLVVAAALIAVRGGLKLYFTFWGENVSTKKKVIVIGDAVETAQLLHKLGQDDNSTLEICGIFYSNCDEANLPPELSDYPCEKLEGLWSFVQSTSFDVALLALPSEEDELLSQAIKLLSLMSIDIRLAAHMPELSIEAKSCSFVGRVPVFNIVDKPITGWNVVLKWIFDKVLGSLLLIAFSLPMLAVAIAIKLEDGGSIFFRQKRIGFKNELIEIYKFRSMYETQADQQADKLVTKDDARVTKVGRFIRKTSLDELPQLINVLMGEISLVGPRPHALKAKASGELYDKVVDGYFARHKVKPGITGWAQINGWRGETDTSEKIIKRVEFDLYYIKHWSLLFDLMILLKTPYSLLKTDKAY